MKCEVMITYYTKAPDDSYNEYVKHEIRESGWTVEEYFDCIKQILSNPANKFHSAHIYKEGGVT